MTDVSDSARVKPFSQNLNYNPQNHSTTCYCNPTRNAIRATTTWSAPHVLIRNLKISIEF